MSIDWNDPTARLDLLERIGPAAYNKAIEEHFQEKTIEICNGYALREVASQFGKVISVDGTRQAFRDLERARGLANGLEPGPLADPAEARRDEGSGDPMHMLDVLTAEYQSWLAAEGLPDTSADEVILDENLTPAQREYLSGFILRWEAAVDSAS